MYVKNKFKSLLPVAIFLIVFYAVDIFRLYLEHITHFHIDRIFTWLIPTLLFITFVLKKNPFDYLKLRSDVKKGVFWGIIISIIHVFLYCSLRYLWNNELAVNFNLTFGTFWDVILTVGLVEEIVFRGLVLHNLNEIFSFKTSNILSATLFLIAHIPYWYFGKQFSLPVVYIIYDFFFIFIFGLLEGLFVKKTNSLWTCIIHHSFNNALVTIVK